MAKEENRTIRILYIVKILWEETDEAHPMSAAQMASRVTDYGICCERKAVYRYLEDLVEFGMDIVRTPQGAYLGSRQFELPELKLLVDAVQSSKFITEKKSHVLIGKLGKLLSRYDRNQLNRQVQVENHVKTMNESIYYNIDAICQGIQKNQQIAFLYWNWNAKKEMVPKHDGKQYVISPWTLQWENEKYYLVGYDEQAVQMKHFRVDKMQKITVLDAMRKGRKLFEQKKKGEFSPQTFGMFSGCQEMVTLQLSQGLAGVVIDRFGKDVWMHATDENFLNVMVDVQISNQFFGWIVGLGGGAKIVGPAWVVEEYQQLLKQLLNDNF